MLPLNDIISKLRRILVRFEQFCLPGCFAFVQVELAASNEQTSKFAGVVTDIRSVAELPGAVGLELKLECTANNSCLSDSANCRSRCD